MTTTRWLVVSSVLGSACGDSAAGTGGSTAAVESTGASQVDDSGPGSSAGDPTGGPGNPPPATSGSTDAGVPGDDSTGAPGGGMNFEARCAGPGVLTCLGLDTQAEADAVIVDSGFTPPLWDATTKAEGEGAVRMDVLPGSAANTSGNISISFEPGVGEGETLYVQWRQRFSSEFLATDFDANGWKQLIINENTSTAGCSDSEVVVTNNGATRFPIVYHACNIFEAVHENPVDGDIYEFNRQPGGENRCLYSWYTDDTIDHLEPTDDIDEPACLGYEPEQWLTFQVAVHLNAWCYGIDWEACPADNRIEMWVTDEAGQTTQTIDWAWPLRATTEPGETRYTKMIFTPYQTDKNPAQQHEPSELWYDSIIVSTERIPDPG